MKQEIVQPTTKNAQLARRLVTFVLFFNAALVMAALCEMAASGAQGLGMALVLALIVDVPIALYAFSQDVPFVWRCQHTFDRVCRGLDGNFKYEGFSLANSMRKGFASRGQYVGNQTKTVYPTLRSVTVSRSRETWEGLVKPNPGQNIEDFNQHADAFALAYHVPFVNFEEAGKGLIYIRAGKVLVPAEYEFQLNQQFAASKLPQRWVSEVSLVDTQQLTAVRRQQVARRETRTDAQVSVRPQYERASNVSYEQALARLKRVPMARDMQGRIWCMPIEGMHVLIAARTGGGKGSWVFSLVLQLAPAWRHGLVQFWGCDPKRLELSIGRDWWEHYADTDEGMVKLLEQAVQEMFERGSQLQGVARKFTPSRQTPLNVIVIDELGYLSSLLTDRKLQMRADYAIKTLLTQGRSNGYSVVGCCQDVRKSTVEYRDLFPIRIAGGLNEAKMVDLVLGEGMHEAGAVCERVPLGREGAGVAFVLDAERANRPLLVRAAWCSDVAIRNALVPQVRALAEAYEVKDEDLSQQLQIPPNMQQA